MSTRHPLYEKFGFRKLCTFPAFFRIGGQDIDFDVMLPAACLKSDCSGVPFPGGDPVETGSGRSATIMDFI